MTTLPFTRIGLLYHPRKPESLALADQMGDFLGKRGCQVWSGSAWDELSALAQAIDLDLLITLGGDGTILRAARIASMGTAAPTGDPSPRDVNKDCAPATHVRRSVPILGVKLGRVSFLAEVAPDDWQKPLEAMLAGHYWLEERMLLDVVVVNQDRADAEKRPSAPSALSGVDPPWPTRPSSPDLPLHYRALNDVVISRGGLARMVTVETWVDQSYLTRYRADGVLVATPTGCTGYALAAGGPILPPELRNILLIPICPHLSLDRPIILSQGATVSLRVSADHPPILSVDGQFEVTLVEGDRVDVRASEHVSQFVHMQDRAYFYRTLMDRLRWPVSTAGSE